MDLKFSIEADYKKASQAFKDLANESEATREKIEKFSDSFKTEQVDKFVDKQKLLQAAFTSTKGEVAAMTAAQKNYEKEIEKLIRSGLDPESEAIQKLRNEHDNLAKKIEKTNEVQKKQEELMKGAEKAALGYFAALAAGVAAIGVATQKTAEAGDQFAKTSRIIGMTAETFQELDYAAKMSGVDNLKGSLEKLNKSVADVKSGTGTLTTYLKNNDQQLLSQLENVNSNEEAFNLLMDAISKAPDEFSRAELAQAAFGKSGQQLILLANEGADGISNLREEARKYGVISNETAANSEAFLDAQARLKAALTGVSTELTAGLLPGLTETITKIADFIAGIDNWEEKLEIAGYALAGVTAGLTTFLIVAKGSALIHGLATAFRALTAAIASNPIGAIAVVITAVLVPALLALYKNWDTVQTYLQQGIARVQFAFSWLGSVIKEGLVVAFNTVKAAAVTLFDFIYGNIIRGIGSMLEILGKLPFVGDLFKAASEKVSSLGNAIGNLAEQTRQSSRDAIQAAHDEQNATEEKLRTTLATIDSEAQARRAAIEAQKKENQEVVNSNIETNDTLVEDTVETQDEITETQAEAAAEQTKNIVEHIKALRDRLNEIPLSEQAVQTQQMDQFRQFLQQRMELQKLSDNERIAWLEEQKETLLALETLTGEEKLALEKTINDMIFDENEQAQEKLKKLQEATFTALRTRLNEIPLTDLQVQNQQIDQFKQFLQERMELQLANQQESLESEQTIEEQRIAWLREQQAALLELETLTGEEKIALEKAINDMIIAETKETQEEKNKLQEEANASILERLNEIPFSEQAVQTQQMEQFEQFLQQRMELQQLNDEERIAWLEEQQSILMELETLNGEEKIALEKAVNDMIFAEDEKLKKGQQDLLNKQLKGLTAFYNGVGELAELGAEKSIGLLIVEKAAASAQALINSYLAFTSVLKDVPFPFNIAAAAGVLASGIAQQVKIVSTPIPSAETGGRFIVPNSVGSDTQLMRVNQGEEINVTPRGMTGNNNTQNIIVQIDRQTIFDVVNDGIGSGDILIAASNY
jgi:hypothetical protein